MTTHDYGLPRYTILVAYADQESITVARDRFNAVWSADEDGWLLNIGVAQGHPLCVHVIFQRFARRDFEFHDFLTRHVVQAHDQGTQAIAVRYDEQILACLQIGHDV